MNKVPVFSSGEGAAAAFIWNFDECLRNEEKGDEVGKSYSDGPLRMLITDREKAMLLKIVDQVASDLKLGDFALFERDASARLNKFWSWCQGLPQLNHEKVNQLWRPGGEISERIQFCMRHKTEAMII